MPEIAEKLRRDSLSALSNLSIPSPSDPSSEDSSSEEEAPIPVQSLGPSAGTGMEGDGDFHSLRSVGIISSLSHLSPIGRSFGNHQFNCETPPSSTAPGPEVFLTAFENVASSEKKSEKHLSLPKELLLSEKIGEMNESDAKQLLTKVLLENLGLRQELKSKEKKMQRYKGQMLAILDWKTGDQMETNDKDKSQADDSQLLAAVAPPPPPPLFSSSPSQNNKEKGGIPNKKRDKNETPGRCSGEVPLQNVQGVRMVEEVYGIRRSLSFFQEFASSIEMDQELLKERIKGGYYLTNQLIIGSLSGWLSAAFLKKFGKIALSAAGGGLLLLVYTARKGYVNVNYESIYEEISRICEESEETDLDASDNETQGQELSSLPTGTNSARKTSARAARASTSSQSWGYEKVKTARKWISTHTYTVGGFLLTFIYNVI